MTPHVNRTLAVLVVVFTCLLSSNGIVLSQQEDSTNASETDAKEADAAAGAADESEADESEADEAAVAPIVVAPIVVTPLDEEGRLVRFDRDVAPIFRKHCLECHGPEDAKNDFRVDDPDTLMEYVEPEDWEWSTLYADYLVTEDEDMLMPPKSHGGPLSASELALIRVWIDEGAHWPDGFEMVAESDAEVTDEESTESPAGATGPPKTLSERVWVFQGYLHPATVHFPIALFLLGGFFVVLGWKWPSVGTQIPVACLLLGTLSAVAATLMGWAFAPEQGYGNNWTRLDWDREVDVHRWSAVVVTVLSAALSLIALIAFATSSERLTRVWRIGLLALAAMVGAVGHQGGEMSYGSDFYPKAFRILFGTGEAVAAVDEPADGERADVESGDGTPAAVEAGDQPAD